MLLQDNLVRYLPIWNTILLNEVYILRHIMSGSSIKHGRVKIDPFFSNLVVFAIQAQDAIRNDESIFDSYMLLYYVQPSYALKYELH